MTKPNAANNEASVVWWCIYSLVIDLRMRSLFTSLSTRFWTVLPLLSLRLFSRAYIMIYTLSSQILHPWGSCFWQPSSPDRSDVACIRWSFRSMCGSLQGSFSWFILLDCVVIVLFHSSLKGQKRPSFPSGMKFFFTPCKYLVYGEMNATLWGILSTFFWKDLVCI